MDETAVLKDLLKRVRNVLWQESLNEYNADVREVYNQVCAVVGRIKEREDGTEYEETP